MSTAARLVCSARSSYGHGHRRARCASCFWRRCRPLRRKDSPAVRLRSGSGLPVTRTRSFFCRRRAVENARPRRSPAASINRLVRSAITGLRSACVSPCSLAEVQRHGQLEARVTGDPVSQSSCSSLATSESSKQSPRKSECNEQTVQVNQRRQRAARDTDLHASTRDRIQHPTQPQQSLRRTGASTWTTSPSDSSLAVVTLDTTPMKRMPSIVDNTSCPIWSE